MRLTLACRLFFRALRDAEFAARALAPVAAAKPLPATNVPAAPSRSEALVLLALLQREGRLVDFLQEPITAFTDAQIGAAVRDVHAGSRRALERIFGLAAAIPEAEGSTLRITAGQDTSSVRLTGAVTGTPPYTGIVQHGGWRATRCALPAWTGNQASVLLIAPAEVEIQAAGAR